MYNPIHCEVSAGVRVTDVMGDFHLEEMYKTRCEVDVASPGVTGDFKHDNDFKVLACFE